MLRRIPRNRSNDLQLCRRVGEHVPKYISRDPVRLREPGKQAPFYQPIGNADPSAGMLELGVKRRKEDRPWIDLTGDTARRNHVHDARVIGIFELLRPVFLSINRLFQAIDLESYALYSERSTAIFHNRPGRTMYDTGSPFIGIRVVHVLRHLPHREVKELGKWLGLQHGHWQLYRWTFGNARYQRKDAVRTSTHHLRQVSSSRTFRGQLLGRLYWSHIIQSKRAANSANQRGGVS